MGFQWRRRSPSLTSARCCPNRQDLWHLPDLEIDWMARKGEPIVRLKFRRDSSRSTQKAFLITISNQAILDSFELRNQRIKMIKKMKKYLKLLREKDKA